MLLRLVAVLSLVITACGSAAGSDTGRVTAVASVYPLAWIAQTIAPEADITFLASSGQDPHDQELSPQQRAAVERADVAVYLGAIGFQPQVEAAVADRSGPVVSAAEVVGETALLDIADEGHDEEQEHAEDEAAGAQAKDPHLWFDPELMAEVATATGAGFAEADPQNAATYTANAAAVVEQLTGLTDEIATLLSDCEHDEVIVSHEAYAYLLEPHGLTQHGISSAAGHSGASPGDITRLVDQIRSEGIPAVLSEPVEGRKDAETVAREAGVELIEVYSLDIVDDERAQAGFPALLREQAEAVARAAGCTAS